MLFFTIFSMGTVAPNSFIAYSLHRVKEKREGPLEAKVGVLNSLCLAFTLEEYS